MDTATRVRQPEGAVSAGAALLSVLLPGRLRTRTEAAGALPDWLAILLALVCFAISIELIGYIYSVAHTFLRVIYDRWDQAFLIPRRAPWVFLEVAAMRARPAVLPGLVESSSSLAMSLAGLGLLAGLLESLNLVVLAPFAAGYGEALGRAAHKARRILLSLGGLWLLTWSISWAVLFLAGGAAWLYFGETWRFRISYTTLDDMIRLGFGAVLLLVLLMWLVRLVRAASYLQAMPREPLPSRCSQCGYLLHGRPAGSDCPDCGRADPSSPDKARQPSLWLDRRRVGRLRALTSVSSAVARRPAEFFGRLQVLCDHREALRFVRWNLWLCVWAWVLAVPGITSAMIDPNDVFIVNKVISAGVLTSVVALTSGLTGALLLGLVISVMGFAISRQREEPSWPIAAEAGCYLSSWLPRIAAAQALWVTLLFTLEQLVQRGMFLRLSRQTWIHTGVPWEIVLSVTFGLPMLVGLVLLVRAAIVCYRNTRYACR